MKNLNSIDWVEVVLHLGGVVLSIVMLFFVVFAFGLVFVSSISWVFKVLSLPIIFLILGFSVTIFWDEVKSLSRELKD